MDFELVQFLKESAKLAGFPVPMVVFSGSSAAVQYGSTMDSYKEKSIIMLDFGQMNTCITHVKYNNINKKNSITATGYNCSSLYSGQYLDNACTNLIVSKAAKKSALSDSEKQPILHSARALKEKLTSNENFMMAVLTKL